MLRSCDRVLASTSSCSSIAHTHTAGSSVASGPASTRHELTGVGRSRNSPSADSMAAELTTLCALPLWELTAIIDLRTESGSSPRTKPALTTPTCTLARPPSTTAGPWAPRATTACGSRPGTASPVPRSSPSTTRRSSCCLPISARSRRPGIFSSGAITDMASASGRASAGEVQPRSIHHGPAVSDGMDVPSPRRHSAPGDTRTRCAFKG